MARIAGVDLPREKRVEIGLTYIYGIGLTTSQKMLAEVGINPDTRGKDLSERAYSDMTTKKATSTAALEMGFEHARAQGFDLEK